MAVELAFGCVAGRLAVGVDEREALDLEAEVGAHLLEQGDVALALVAEVEVLPHDHDLGAEAVDEHLLHELLGRLLRAGLVEGDHEAAVDARWRRAARASGRGR